MSMFLKLIPGVTVRAAEFARGKSPEIVPAVNEENCSESSYRKRVRK